MYKVFIVDDEIIVREGIRNKIQWEKTPFNFLGEASDGEIALSMIQELKPDILITDIKMPFMDGLELSMIVKNIQPWIRIIILSGHDEFNYAKEAIKIGVDDYILKPFSPEDLMKSMLKASRKIDLQRKQNIEPADLENKTNTTQYIVKQNFLKTILFESHDTTFLQEHAKKANIDINAPFFIVCICKVYYPLDNSISLQNIRNRIHVFIKDKPQILFHITSPNCFVFILKNYAREKIDEESFSLAETIQHEIHLEKDTTVITAIGSIVESPEQIQESYSDAKKIISLCKISGKSRIFSYDDIKANKNNSLIIQEYDPLVDQLKYASEGEIEKIIDGYISLLEENPGHFNIFASYLLIDVIMVVSKLIEELGDNIKNVMPRVLSREFVAHSVDTPSILIQEIRGILHGAIHWRDKQSSGRYADVILKAKRYIEEHFFDPSVRLHVIAEHVCLSPNHFSTVFSQECGITFIEYLTDIRINKAKEFLKTTQKRSADIAYEIGFSDPHYFSYIFKKHTGMSPREYRQLEKTKKP
ncbi:MAG TPA: response regulator [Treponemataceae bacterium]|nr:response regulator [Treponemataceae bacterium]